MSNYPKDSMGAAEERGAKIFGAIAIVAFIVLHVIVILVSATPFQNIKNSPALAIVNVAAVLWLAACVIAVMKDTMWVTTAKWPYILLILLAFASAVVIGYCPSC